MSKKLTKEEKFLKRHRKMGDKEKAKELLAQKKVKAEYSRDLSQVEAALTEFLKEPTPIIWKGKAIAWVRQPTMKEIKELVPAELMKYADNPEGAPLKIQQQYEDHFYEKMALLIVTPELTAEQWKSKSNPTFLKIFWEHIGKIAQEVQVRTEGF
jgi:hypothetical protein